MKRTGWHLFQIVCCYVGGIFLGCLLYVPFVGGMAVAFFMFGMMIVLPLLVVTLCIFVVLHRVILRNLGVSCIVMALLIGAIWPWFIWRTDGPRDDEVFWQFLTEELPLDLGLLGLVCASCSALLFWLWNRKRAT